MKKRTVFAALLSMCLLFTGCKSLEEFQTAETTSSVIVSSVISTTESGDASLTPESSGLGSTNSFGDSSSSINTSVSSDTNSTDQPSASVPESSDISSSDNGTSSADTSKPTSTSRPTSSSTSKPTSSSLSKSTSLSTSKPTSSSTSKPTSSSTSKPTSSSTSKPTSSSSSKPTSSSSSKPTSSSSSNVTKPDPITNGGFQVSGTKLLDANGNEFIMRGINHAHAWYTSELNQALDGIAKTGANTVRVVLADGDQWGKTSASDLQNIINQCEQRNMIAVVEVHDATGNDNVYALKNAANYWIEMKDILNAHKDTVIVNIANEWHHESWGNPGAWAAGYIEVIPMLRNAGIENTLMVDCDGYGQFADSLFRNNYAKSIFNADSRKNTMFSIHMYDSAGKDASTVKGHINNCYNAEICAVIGEFAADHGNRGDVDEQTIMSYCTEKGMGYIGWSWKGNTGDGLESLDIAYDWSGNSLSSWGNTLVNGTNGIKQTSKTCSVFG